MKYGNKLAPFALLMLTLASCGLGGGQPETVSSSSAALPTGVQDYPVKIGEPYKIGETGYTPEDSALYDDVGFAGSYGKELGGKATANGEVFASAAVTAAHKTLPMPSYAEVTALDTGRTILVRINDRGPFANERIIDLSEGAARQLGLSEQGVAGVRVRRVNPPEQDRAALRAGLPAAVRMDTPESLLKVLRDKLSRLPKAAPNTAPPPPIAAQVLKAADQKKAATAKAADTNKKTATGALAAKPGKAMAAAPAGAYIVQIAAFGSRANADKLAKQLDAKVAATADGRLHRVRFGPFASESEAKAALERVKKHGYPQARLYRE
jgi:rare lipoprotein A